MAETNKILGLGERLRLQRHPRGRRFCVRDRRHALSQPGAHDQADPKDVPIDEIHGMLAEAHEWVKVDPQHPGGLAGKHLTPACGVRHVIEDAGRPSAQAGRWGVTTSRAFTVGDQLLWGAAEPLRRMLRILLER